MKTWPRPKLLVSDCGTRCVSSLSQQSSAAMALESNSASTEMTNPLHAEGVRAFKCS